MKRRAFTLVELAIVLLILAILVALALPKFAAMRVQAIEANENSVVGALTEAISNERMTTTGLGTTSPFTLLAASPPYEDLDGQMPGFSPPDPDGKSWRTWNIIGVAGSRTVMIACPHYDGTKGVLWRYVSFTGIPSGRTWQVLKLEDHGH